MKVAFVIFDRMTSLDFIAAFDPIVRLSTMGYVEDFCCSVCARESPVVDDRGPAVSARPSWPTLERI